MAHLLLCPLYHALLYLLTTVSVCTNKLTFGFVRPLAGFAEFGRRSRVQWR